MRRNGFHSNQALRSTSEFTDVRQDPEDLVARYIDHPRPELRDLIMVEYSSMVERIARKFAGIETFDDLAQVGYIGLLNALSKFDPTAGVRFNTYATYLVAGEIKHYLRDRAQTIRHPAWLQELRHKVNKTVGILQQELGRVPTEREIADQVGVSEVAIREVFQTQEMLRVASLDAPAGPGDDGTSEGEKLDTADFCPEQLGLEDRMLLEHALGQLRDLERDVLVMYHFDSLNQTEIAGRLNISCNYVSHILRQSIAKLRKIMTTEESKDRMLRREAQHIDWEIIDESTGAYTESYFRNRLEEEVHRALSNGDSVTLVVVDFIGLDRLKRFYGEQSVIDFMADAAGFFRANVRRLDVVARLGDSAFAMILPATGASMDLVRQNLIKRATRWTSGKFGPTGGIGVEIGYVTAPDHGRNGSEMMAELKMNPLTFTAAISA